MKVSWKLLGRSLLFIAQCRNGLLDLGGGGRALNDERSGRPKEATIDENFEIVHSLVVCDRSRNLRDIAS